MRGMPSQKIYAIAAYDSIEFKYKPSSGLLTVNVRTYMAGTGNSNLAEVENQLRDAYEEADN